MVPRLKTRKTEKVTQHMYVGFLHWKMGRTLKSPISITPGRRALQTGGLSPSLDDGRLTDEDETCRGPKT